MQFTAVSFPCQRGFCITAAIACSELTHCSVNRTIRYHRNPFDVKRKPSHSTPSWCSPVVDPRSDCDLRSGEQLLHSHSHHVRRRVPQPQQMGRALVCWQILVFQFWSVGSLLLRSLATSSSRRYCRRSTVHLHTLLAWHVQAPRPCRAAQD